MKVTLSVNYEDSEISLSNADLAQVAKLIEAKGADVARKVPLIHRKSGFQILTYAIRICNVQTGRLRGAFTPFMRKYGYSNFEAYMAAPPIGGAGPRPKGKVKTFDQGAADQGTEEGSFIDEPLNTVISNNVAYASFVDAKTGLIVRILDWGAVLYQKNFGNFFAAIEAQDGKVPPVDPNEGGTGE